MLEVPSHSMSRTGVVALALCMLAAAPRVRAQTPAADAEARARFDAGRMALDSGRAEDALADFERAYSLSPRTEMLYNIGVAAQRSRHRARAVEAYREYLRLLPAAENRPEVEARISEVEELIAAEQHPADVHATPPPDATPTPTTPIATVSTGPGAGPWILTIGSGVVTAAGIVLVALALADVSTVENAPPGSMWSSVAGAYDQAPLFSTLGFITAGIGLAGVVAGLAWLVMGNGHAERAPEGPHVAFGLHGLSIDGAF